MRLHLYLRGRIWWARGSEGGDRFRRSTHETVQRKARIIADRWERLLADPDHFRAHKATVQSACERWMREITIAKKAPTVRFYKTRVQHLCRLIGGVKLAKLTHDRMMTYIEKREAEGGEKSIGRELTALRQTLKSAQRAREFGRDPKSVIPAYGDKYVPLTDIVEAETIWAAIAHLHPNRGAAVAWAIATASDFSSLFTARRSDVTDDFILVRGTKTTTRQRKVPRIKVMDVFVRHALAYGNADLLFDQWHSMPRDVRRACRRAGVPEFTARTLRRSAATWLVRAGVPYEVAAKFLGHGNTMMLQRVYGQLPPPDAGRLIDERLS